MKQLRKLFSKKSRDVLEYDLVLLREDEKGRKWYKFKDFPAPESLPLDRLGLWEMNKMYASFRMTPEYLDKQLRKMFDLHNKMANEASAQKRQEQLAQAGIVFNDVLTKRMERPEIDMLMRMAKVFVIHEDEPRSFGSDDERSRWFEKKEKMWEEVPLDRDFFLAMALQQVREYMAISVTDLHKFLVQGQTA